MVTTANDLCNETGSQNRRLNVVQDITYSNSGFDRQVELCENRVEGRIFSQRVIGFERNLQTYQWQVAFKNSDVFIDLQEDDTYSNVTGNNLNPGGANVPLQIDTARISLDSTRYRLVIKGCESDFISDTTLLTINQTPIITNIGENQLVCIGEDTEAVFAVSAIGDNLQYRWDYSADSEFTSPSVLRDFSGNLDTLRVTVGSVPTGFVRAVVRNDISCNQLVFSSPIQLVVNEVTILNEGLVDPNTKCVGDEYGLFVNTRGENLTFQWQVREPNGDFVDITDNDLYSGINNDTLLILITEEMRDFEYRCIVGGNCESKESRNIRPNVQFIGEVEIISEREFGGQVSLFVNRSFQSIAWYDEEGNVVSNSNPFLPSEPGTYTAEVFINNCSAISEPFTVDEVLSLDKQLGFEIFPNPTVDKIHVRSDMQNIDKVELIDISGKVLKSKEVNGNEASFSMEAQKAGVYFINIHWGEKVTQQRIIKQ
jgi:hypothetical protein